MKKNIDKILLITTAIPVLISLILAGLFIFKVIQNNVLNILLFVFFGLSFVNSVILIIYCLSNEKNN